MPTFTVNGRLAALAQLAGGFAEFRLKAHGPEYSNEPAIIVQFEDGTVKPMPLPVQGVNIDAAREVAFKVLFGEGAGIARAVFFSEAWSRSVASREERDALQSLHADPARVEVIVLDGRDRAGNALKATREIVRGAEPHLLPVKYTDPAMSRYVPSIGGREG